MKKLKLFTDNMEPYGSIKQWKYNFRKLSSLFLIISILLLSICIVLGVKYNHIKMDTNEIVSCISQASDNPCTGNLERLIGKYHVYPNKKMSDSTVFNIIKECGAWYPEIIMAQYIIESGSGSSYLAKTANNLFGMRVAMRRSTTQLSGTSNSGYGVYLNKEHSIIDRILWDRWLFKNEKPSYENYMNKIGTIYAETPDYRERLESVAKKWKS